MGSLDSQGRITISLPGGGTIEAHDLKTNGESLDHIFTRLQTQAAIASSYAMSVTGMNALIGGAEGVANQRVLDYLTRERDGSAPTPSASDPSLLASPGDPIGNAKIGKDLVNVLHGSPSVLGKIADWISALPWYGKLGMILTVTSKPIVFFAYSANVQMNSEIVYDQYGLEKGALINHDRNMNDPIVAPFQLFMDYVMWLPANIYSSIEDGIKDAQIRYQLQESFYPMHYSGTAPSCPLEYDLSFDKDWAPSRLPMYFPKPGGPVWPAFTP